MSPLTMRLLIFLLLASLSWPAGQVWMEVPTVRQQKDGCGAAVLSMLVRYWKPQTPWISEDGADAIRIHRKVFARVRNGTPANAMVDYLKGLGFQVFTIAGERRDLDQHLRKGRPLVVSLKDGPRLHYVVVRGLDEGGVWVNDPADGESRRIDWNTFEALWSGGNNWLLLAVPKPSS